MIYKQKVKENTIPVSYYCHWYLMAMRLDIKHAAFNA